MAWSPQLDYRTEGGRARGARSCSSVLERGGEFLIDMMLGDETWILLTGDHAQLHERRRAHELRGCDNASSSQQGHTSTCCLRPPPTGLSRAMDGSDDYV